MWALLRWVNKISLFRQTRDDDELLMRRMESMEAMSDADSYQKLRMVSYV